MVDSEGQSPDAISRNAAILNSYRLFNSALPDARVRQVEARLVLKHWVVNFWKMLPPDVIESPGLWTIYVDAETGQARWLEDMQDYRRS